jgi:ribonuclease P protein component
MAGHAGEASGAPPGPARRNPRRGRLSRNAEFERVYRQGRSHGNRYLVLYSFPRRDGEEPRLGVSVSRRVGGAVVRNRVKRVLREAFHAREGVPAGHDFVLVARPDAADLVERDGVAGVSAALGELLQAAGTGEADAARRASA